jgi:hypothetical protein
MEVLLHEFLAFELSPHTQPPTAHLDAARQKSNAIPRSFTTCPSHCTNSAIPAVFNSCRMYGERQKRDLNFIQLNSTASAALCDAAHRLHHGVLCCQNVTRVHVTVCMLSINCSTALPVAVCTISQSANSINCRCITLTSRERNVESAGRN